MIFPLEIWEYIFLHVDPLTLVNLKRVCKCWNEIITKILKHSNLWYKFCEDKIPKPFWTTLCETLSPTVFYTHFHEKNDVMLWMAMYKLWVKCKNIEKCETQVKCIEPLLNHSTEYITCMDTSGPLLAVGTSEGFIYFSDIRNLHKSLKSVVDHIEYVQYVQLLRDDTNIICISCSLNGHICFWDVKLLKLVDNTHGNLICSSYSYCYSINRNVISIEGSIPRTIFQFSEENIVAAGADNNKVHFYTEGGYCVHLTLDTENNYYTYVCVPPPNVRIRRYYVFKPNVFVCITENGYLGFMVEEKEWKLHNIFPILHGVPTAVLVYAHALFLGLDSGTVHIYYTQNFSAINFNNCNSKKLIFDTSAVISLNILVDIEEYLIVSYRKKVYVANLI